MEVLQKFIVFLFAITLTWKEKEHFVRADLGEYEYDDGNYNSFSGNVPQSRILLPLWRQKFSRFTSTTSTTAAPTTTTAATTTKKPEPEVDVTTKKNMFLIRNVDPNFPNQQIGRPESNSFLQDQVFIGFAPIASNYESDTDIIDAPPIRRRIPSAQQFQPILIFRQNPNNFGIPFGY